ncbi:MAG TPA: hypothetical protein VHK88_14380, partial [Aquihabitans sp.]|nr:hypothetical protein [Aquihabitans sp.]
LEACGIVVWLARARCERALVLAERDRPGDAEEAARSMAAGLAVGAELGVHLALGPAEYELQPRAAATSGGRSER